MAKSSSATSKSAGSRQRAVPPSQKGTRKKLGAQQPEPENQAFLDDGTHRRIIGIVCLVLAVAILLIVAWPTNAVVTSALSLILRCGLGIGAYLLPVVLGIVAATYLTKVNNERLPTRVIVGLAIFFVGLLVLLALFTPGAVGSSGPTAELFSESQVVARGGYLGAGPAFVGIMLLGLPVSVVLAIGIMVIGLAVIGISIQRLIEHIKRKRAEAEALEEEEFGVAPDSPYVPAVVGARRSNTNSTARTRAIGTANSAEVTRRLNDREPRVREDEFAPVEFGNADTMLLDESQVSTTRANPRENAKSNSRSLTRKLGKRKNDDANKAKAESAKAESAKTIALDDRQDGTDAQDDSFQLPKMSLLKVGKAARKTKAFENELTETAAHLQQTMEDFGIMATVVDWVAGPTVTLFEVNLPPGVRVSRITALQDDIALALAAPGVRIFAPIPGTHYVGIEVPNATRENVLLGDVLKEVHGGPLEMAIGKDVEGNAIICDLAKMPHLLIGGTTGSGKSVGINAMIMSMLMRSTPSQVRFIMIDPKRVEFAPYDGIPHLYVPVVTEPKEAASALSWGVAEMERRLKVFSKVGVRNIGSYNEKVRAGELEGQNNEDGSAIEPLPYIVIIIDELADLMMNVGKEVEFSISRIAQLARAAGIHLIVATQRPSANVVTGLIKANITNRMAFNVASGLDSRVILDTSGAEALIGNGDLLLSKPEYPKPVRIQGCFTSDEEIAAVVEAVKSQGEPEYHSEILKTNLITLGDSMPDASGGSGGGDDPLIWEAAEIVVASGLGSTSNIQRKLKVGYSRAGRIMDMLEEKGVVGPPNGSKPREVLVDAMELETLKAFEAADE